MGLELARAYVTVRADITGLRADFDRVKAEFGKIEKGASQVAAVTKASLAGVVAFLLQKVVSFGSDFLRHGDEVGNVLDTITVEMEQLTGSAEGAAEMMARFRQFSRDSGIAVPEIAKLARNLVVAGKSGAQVTGILELLGDASGGTTEKFHTLVNAYSKLTTGGGAGAGKIMMGLTRGGVITVKDFAEQLGKSESQVSKLIKTGKIGLPELIKTMEGMTAEGGRMHNALEKQANTSARLSAAYKAAKDSLAAMLYKPLSPYFDTLTRALTETVYALTDFVEWGGKTLSFMVQGAVYAAGLVVAVVALGAAWLAFVAIVPIINAALVSVGIAVQFSTGGLLLFVTVIAVAVVALGAALGGLVAVTDAPTLLADAWRYLQSVFERSGLMEVIYDFMDIWSRVLEVATMVMNAIVELFAPAGTKIGAFLDDWLMRFIKFYVDVLASVADFVLDVLEWYIVLTKNWGEIWEKSRIILAYFMLVFRDMVNNTVGLMVADFKAGFVEIVMAAAEMGVAVGKIINGMLLGPVHTFATAGVEAILAKKKKEGPKEKKTGILDKVTKTSPETDAFFAAMGLGDLGDKLLADKDELENGRRRFNQNPFGKDKDKGGLPGPPEKAGISSIADFGRKIQEAILKDDKVVNAIEVGNELARRQIDLSTQLLNKPVTFVVS